MKRVTWVAIAAAGMLIPSAAQAQVTAYAVIPSWTQSKVLVKDAHTGAAVASIPLTGEPYDAAITPDGRRAYVTLRASHQVAVIDLGTLQVVTTIAMGLEPRGVAITPDGARAWVTEAGSHTVSAITLIVELNGVKPGLQYDRLVAKGSVSLNGATLVVVPGGPMPKGATFTIVTHANGTFAGLPEGALIVTAFGKFRISYTGGPTQTDVVLTAQ